MNTEWCVVCGSVFCGERIVLAREKTPEAAARSKHRILVDARLRRAAGEDVRPFVSLRVEVC